MARSPSRLEAKSTVRAHEGEGEGMGEGLKTGEDTLRGLNRKESGEGEDLEEIAMVGRALGWELSNCWS